MDTEMGKKVGGYTFCSTASRVGQLKVSHTRCTFSRFKWPAVSYV